MTSLAPRLIPLSDVAQQAGVPPRALRRAASEAGLLIKLGGLRIEANRIGDLLEHCRLAPGREV
jgi:hypothetical protein